MPRPPELTDRHEADVLAAIRTGVSERTAAAYAGLPHSTVATWSRTGVQAAEKEPKDRTPHERRCLEFSTKLAKSKSDAVIGWAGIVSTIARGGAPHHLDPNDENSPMIEPTDTEKSLALKAATWMLERRAKDEFSTRIEVTGADGGALAVQTTFDADLATRMAALDAAATLARAKIAEDAEAGPQEEPASS